MNETDWSFVDKCWSWVMDISYFSFCFSVHLKFSIRKSSFKKHTQINTVYTSTYKSRWPCKYTQTENIFELTLCSLFSQDANMQTPEILKKNQLIKKQFTRKTKKKKQFQSTQYYIALCTTLTTAHSCNNFCH